MSGSTQQDAHCNPPQAAGGEVASAATQDGAETDGSSATIDSDSDEQQGPEGTHGQRYRYSQSQLREIGEQIGRQIERQIRRRLISAPQYDFTMRFWY
ncbi:GL19656 [Drosophila persimilis]|uniref:GL19656 n=2 Tax=Drosophila persimilis TaxID=7234 RepID=B4G7S2_DROPE|nr:GL19656 [Drosophila persimilis]